LPGSSDPVHAFDDDDPEQMLAAMLDLGDAEEHTETVARMKRQGDMRK